MLGVLRALQAPAPAEVLRLMAWLSRPPDAPTRWTPMVPGGVVVTPKDSSIYTLPSASTGANFAVKNTRPFATTYSLNCIAAAPVTSCSPSPSSVTLDSMEQEEVLVSYTTSASAGTGTLRLAATGAATDTGSYDVTVQHTAAATVTQPRQNDSVFNRGHCLTTSRGPLTWSCGDAMYFLSTPGYTTLDRNRGMTLVYASNTVEPRPLIAANVTAGTGPALTRVHAILTVNDTVRTDVSYLPWSAGLTRQIVLGWDAASQATGAYRYDLRVYAVSGSDSTATDATGLSTVVNRSGSAYGNGWEWLGVERLVLQQPFNSSGTSVLWVDGDGSTRLYHQTSTNHWLSARDDGQDSIAYNSGTSQYTRTARHGVQVVFDATGRHIRTVNRAGQVTTFTWVSATQLDSVLLPPSGSGKAFKVQYSSARMSGVRLDGRNIVDTVDASGGPPELTRWIWPDGTSMRFGYESHHRVVYSVYSDADWMWTTYDTLGLIHFTDVYWDDPQGHDSISATDFTPWQELGYASGTASQVAADTAGAYTTIDGPPYNTGRRTVFQVDKWGAPTYERNAYGTVTRYVRGSSNAPGLVSEIDFPNARRASMLYDARGNLTRLADSTWGSDAFPNQVTTWAYTDPHDYDSPSQVTAPDGTITYYGYTTLGLTDTIRDPRGHVTKFDYLTSGALVGQLSSVTERAVPTWIQLVEADSTKDLVTRLGYDALGNLAQDTSAAGGISRYTRDGSGRILSTTNAIGFVEHYTYDPMDRMTNHVALHTKGAVGTACVTNTFVCDSNRILDALNPYDTDTGVSPADSEVTTYTFTLGRLTRVRDPRGVIHQYTYDQRGMLQLNIDDRLHADTSFFDNAGNLVRQVSRDGFATAFHYDSLGRETQWSMPARTTVLFGTSYTAAADVASSTYDSLGNLLTHSSNTGTLTRSYFQNGALQTVRTVSSAGASDTVSYGYDAKGRLLTLGWPRGDTIRYGYNGSTGDLDSIAARWKSGTTIQAAPVILLQTDVMGRRRGVDFQVYGTRDTLHYDALGVLRRLEIVSGSPSSTNRFQATLAQDSVDVLGRPVHQQTVCNGLVPDSTMLGIPCGSWISRWTTTWYNRVGEVARTYGQQFDDTPYTSDTLHYDRSGNRRSHASDALGGSTTSFAYSSSNNRVTSSRDSSWITMGARATTYGYDSSGSRLVDTTNQHVQAYQYDAAERMRGSAQVNPREQPVYPNLLDTLKNGNTCDYNADGQVVRGCGASQVSYVGPNVVREGYGDWWYVLGPGLDEPVLAVKRWNVGGSEVTQAWLPVFSDGRGQLVSIADSAGNLQGNITTPDYDAGLWNSSGLSAHLQTFNPRRQATPGGIDTISTFRARQYDPATGRWLQEDPIGIAGGTNLYEYNGNDPNSFRDPFGLVCPPTCTPLHTFSVAVGGVLGGVFGAGVGGTTGSIVPGAGTVIGGAAGGIEGAAIGAAAGLAVANLAEGAAHIAGAVAGAQVHGIGKVRRALIGFLIGASVAGAPDPAGGDATSNGTGGQTELLRPSPEPKKQPPDTEPVKHPE